MGPKPTPVEYQQLPGVSYRQHVAQHNLARYQPSTVAWLLST